MNQIHDDFDDNTKRVFNGLPQVPDDLQDRTVRELHHRRLLHRPLARVTRFASAAAILIGILLVGYFGHFAPSQAASATHLLLLYEDQDYQASQPGDETARVMEYTAWARKLAEEGKLVDAAELAPDSLVAIKGALPAAHGVNSEFGRIAGFFLISADSARDAGRIAAQCPHLKYGGRVVVRPLVNH